MNDSGGAEELPVLGRTERLQATATNDATYDVVASRFGGRS
jgi:hypothetical protein